MGSTPTVFRIFGGPIFQAHHCERWTNFYVTVWNCMKWG